MAMISNYILRIFVIWGWSLASFASESPVLNLSDLNRVVHLSEYMEILEDERHELTFEEVRSGKHEARWIRVSASKFIGKNFDSRYWFRFTVRWEGATPDRSIILLDTQPALVLRLAVQVPRYEESETEYSTFRSGHIEPFFARPLEGNLFGFPLSLRPNKVHTVIGWATNFETAYPLHLPLKLISTAEFGDRNQIHFGILIAFYTLISALFIYNASLYFSLKEPVYGAYLVFLTCVTLSCTGIDGTASRFFWPDHPMLTNLMASITATGSGASYLLFVVFALDKIGQWPVIGKLVWGSIVGGGFICVLNPFINDDILSLALAQIYAGFAITLTVLIVARAFFLKVPTSGYVFLAVLATMIGNTSFMLLIQGVLPSNNFTSWGVHIGTACEALLLSLALAARTRMAQNSSIENLRKYEAIYEDSLEGRFSLDLRTGEVKCNNSFSTIMGNNQINDADISLELLKELGGDSYKNIESLLAENGAVSNYILEFKNKRGINVWVSVNMRVVEDEYDRRTSIESTIIDISAIKQKEIVEEEKLNEQLQSKAKSQFFASMSHELRTPLTAILGYSEMAIPTAVPLKDKQNALETIHRSGQHLLQLINDILDLSKIEAQKLTVETVSTDLVDLLRDINDYFSILATKKSIGFEINFHCPIPRTVFTDPTRLKQTIINLCGNAVKFTEKGRVTIEVSAADNRMFFEIVDSGIGLMPEQVDKLFGAFSQADASTTRKFGGTGLGLHLSKQIANALGGDIYVESVYGVGSTFKLEIDCGDISEIDIISDTDQLGWDLNRDTKPEEDWHPTLEGNVLYAEDNEENQNLFRSIIEKTGCNIDIVSDGEQALEKARSQNYDIIFSDLRMPKIDGIELGNLLSKMTSNTIMVAITAEYQDSILRKQLIDSGYRKVLGKPISKDDVYETLNELISSPSNNQELARSREPLMILVAEDNVVNQTLIEKHIQRLDKNARVKLVNDGAEAVVSSLTEEFDLILMDINMPTLGGLEATRIIKEKGITTPIYALTAESDFGEYGDSDNSSFQGVLSKPYEVERIKDVLSQVRSLV